MDGRQCAMCGASNPASAEWCSQCFDRFDAGQASPGSAGPVTLQQPAGTPAAATAAPPRSWSCGSCATENPLTTDHCQGCQAPITAALAAPEGGWRPGVGTMTNHGAVASSGGVLPRRRLRRSFGQSLRIGLRLVGVGFRTAWEDPRLLAAPFLSGLATLAVVGVVWLVSGIGPIELAERDQLGFVEWLVVGVITYCGAIFAVLAESFVVAAATLHFDHRDARAARVWTVVVPRLGALVRWAFIKATVSLVFQWLRRKLQHGQTHRSGAGLALDAAEAAWATLTILVVPVILYEDASPGQATRRSMSLFRRTWGQTLAGGFGLGLALAAFTFAAIALTVPLVIVNAGLGITVGILLLVLIQLVGIVAAGVLVAALYRYATTGRLPGGYRPEEVAVVV